MNMQPIFFYDAFLSHRCGDEAADLRTELSALGCSVWFDENKPLSDRRLTSVVATAFGRARTILGYLSRDIASSPWPLLELRCGLATERPNCERVLFFVPDGIQIDRLDLPVDIVKAVKERRLYNSETLQELADVLAGRNRIPTYRFCRFQDGRQRLPLAQTDRTVIRLRNALECFRRSVADTPTDPPSGIRRHGTFEFLVEDPKFFINCAEAILERLLAFGLQEHIGGFNQTLYALRNIVQHMNKCELRPELATLFLAIASASASSNHEDNRANALMLLDCIMSADVSDICRRFLRMRLMREPTWEVARLCHRPPKNGLDLAWPTRLCGVELQALKDKESGVGFSSEALGWLHVDVQLALGNRNQDLASDKLPIPHRLSCELHWVLTLAEETQAIVRRGIPPDSFQARVDLKAIDIELAYRNLHSLVAQLITAPDLDEGRICDSLLRLAEATDRITRVSEESRGLPLSSFTEYYVDHMLPLLGLLILKLDLDDMVALAVRTLRVLTPFMPAVEIDAYAAFIEDCAAWRRARSETFGPGAPLSIVSDGFQIESVSFRKLWLSDV